MKARIFAFRALCLLAVLALSAGCSDTMAPEGPPPATTPAMTVSMSLEAAAESGVPITRVDATIRRDTYSCKVGLTIDDNTAACAVEDLDPGEYSIDVEIYGGDALLASGSGSASIFSNSTTPVTIEVLCVNERLEIVEIWGRGGPDAPELIAPVDGAVLDNGCYDRSDPIVWDFDWTDVDGATSYHLYVKNASARYPAIDHAQLTTSSHHHQCSGCYITDYNRHNWRWRVRANVDGVWGNWSEERTFEAEPLSADCENENCYPNLPAPRLLLTGTEDFDVDGSPYRRYLLAVANWGDYPAEFFTPAPDLPPCGLNRNASRAWLEIYRSNGQRIYGFCALSNPSELQSVWFALPTTESPPLIYVTLWDRRCDVSYTSNTISTGLFVRDPKRILVDASRDGGVWWFPQSSIEGFSQERYHQGQALAESFRAKGYEVDELPRGVTITSSLLNQYDKVIRAGKCGYYSDTEMQAYMAFVSRDDASLILLSEFLRPGSRDELAEALGLPFRGIARGWIADFEPHSITEGAVPFIYNAGSVLLEPESNANIEVLGRLRATDFVDLNGNEVQDSDEPTGSAVMGILHSYPARIFFLGEINGIEGVPQPFVDNLTAWAFGTTE